MNMLNALQTTPAAADAAAKRSSEPKGRDDAVADTGFAKLMQQQTQLRQASQRQLAQRQAEQRQIATTPQATGAGQAQAGNQDLAKTRAADRRSEVDKAAADAEPITTPQLTAQTAPQTAPQTVPQAVPQAAAQPWLQARPGLANAVGGRPALARAESTESDDELPRLNRPGELPVAPDAATTAADAALTANVALHVNGLHMGPSPAHTEAAAADAEAGRALVYGLDAAALAPQTAAASLAQALPRHALLASRNSGEQRAGDTGLGGVDGVDGVDGTAGELAVAGGASRSGHAAAVGHRTDAALASLRAQAEQMALSARPSAPGAGRNDQPDQPVQAPGLQQAAIDSAPRAADTSVLAGIGALIDTSAAGTGPLATADGAALPAQANIPVPLDSPLFAPALGTQISLLARDGVQTALLQLNPAEMGPISVQIVLDGQAAQIDFQADLARTRSVIEASLPALASALQDAGLTLAGGGVFQQSPGRQDAGNGQPQTTSRSSEQRQGTEAAAHAARPTRAATRRGLVDLIA